MKESIESWKAIVLAIEMFCLGGSIFAYSETAQNLLRVGMLVCAVVLFAAL